VLQLYVLLVRCSRCTNGYELHGLLCRQFLGIRLFSVHNLPRWPVLSIKQCKFVHELCDGAVFEHHWSHFIDHLSLLRAGPIPSHKWSCSLQRIVPSGVNFNLWGNKRFGVFKLRSWVLRSSSSIAELHCLHCGEV